MKKAFILMVLFACLALMGWPGKCLGVKTVYVKHNSEEQFKKGDPCSVLINSEGEISLAYQTLKLLSNEDDVWVVNAIVKGPDGSVYAATSGEGYIYRLQEGKKPEIIYGKGKDDQKHVFSLALDNQGRLLAGTGGEAGVLLRFDKKHKCKKIFSDEEIKYIWSIVTGPGGRIYLGTGPTGKVLTLDSKGKNMEVLYKAKDKNILALALDKEGIAYAGGDENGLVYRIDPGSKKTTIAYDTGHSEISGLVFDEEGNLYVSTADASAARPGAQLTLSDGDESRPETSADKDKENMEEKKPQKEVKPDKKEAPKDEKQAEEKEDNDKQQNEEGKGTDVEDDENSAIGKDEDIDKEGVPAVPENTIEKKTSDVSKNVKDKENEKDQAKEEKREEKRGKKTETKKEPEKKTEKQKDKPTTELVPGATAPSAKATKSTKSKAISPKPKKPARENEVFQINPSGYVTKIFSEKVVILSMVYRGDGKLLLGTGVEGELVQLDTKTQEAVVLNVVRPSLQISALWAEHDGKIYAGCANPGAVLKIVPGYVCEGYYISPAIDAEQISKWGKLQIEADIPAGTSLRVSSRSGNTSDPDLGGWQDWTKPQEVAEDLNIEAAPGRFLQYRLQLGSSKANKTVVVKEVKLAYMTPNLPPIVKNVEVSRSSTVKKPDTSIHSSKNMMIKWKTEEPNNDKLKCEIFIRQVGRERWIRIAKEIEEDKYKWDSQTVADGRYEIKVRASDELSNPEGEALTTSRISREVVVDNTPPEITRMDYTLEKNTLRWKAEVKDVLSVIEAVDYVLDSGENRQMALPKDGIFDSRSEQVEFKVKIEEAGEHVLAVRCADALGNETYLNVNVIVPRKEK